VETKILIDSCTVNVVNLTRYEKPPYYTLINSKASKEEKEKANKDWEHSLSPAVAAIIRQADN
jgi:hypothetical protein